MQNLLDDNYFELFGIEKKYLLNRLILRDRFRDLQKQFHPDNFISASQQERRISAQYAAIINEAFTTLNDPVQRGRYMLELEGKASADDTDTRMDPAFLMQQMELREDLDAAKSVSLDALSKLSEKVEAEFSGRTMALGQLLDESEKEGLEKAHHLVRELQFLSRMQNEIVESEESFF